MGGGGGGGGDNSASIQASQMQMMFMAVQAVQAQQQQERDAAQARAEQDALIAADAERQAAYEAELGNARSAMDKLVSDSNARVEEMRKAQEEADRIAKEEAEKQRLAAESAGRVTDMKEGMAADLTAEEDERLRLKKRRATLPGFTTLLTGGQGLTASPSVGTKTLLGQ